MDCFIHQSYGRLRVRVPQTREHRARVPGVLALVKRQGGVRRIRFTSTTGSVVVHFDPRVQSASTLLKLFEEAELLANVIGFPRTPLRMQHKPQKETLERWLGEALEDASKSLFRSLFEMALSKGGQLVIKKLLG